MGSLLLVLASSFYQGVSSNSEEISSKAALLAPHSGALGVGPFQLRYIRPIQSNQEIAVSVLWVLVGTFWYSLVLLGTFGYFWVLWGTLSDLTAKFMDP